MEDQFRSAWETLTLEYQSLHGSLGSRLHKTEDGLWLAYAQWPTREAWEQAKISEASGCLAMDRLGAAVFERFEPILVHTVTDLLGEHHDVD